MAGVHPKRQVIEWMPEKEPLTRHLTWLFALAENGINAYAPLLWLLQGCACIPAEGLEDIY